MSSATVGDSISGDRVDAALLALAQQGDIGAFEALVDRHLGRGYRIASALVGAPEAAAVVGDAFLAAWRQLPRFRATGGFGLWFDSILVGACRMRDRPAPAAAAALGTAPGRAAEPEGEGLDRERALRLLDEAFDRLDVVDRTVLVLHELAGRSAAEIARTVHEPLGPVRVRIAESRAALLRALEPGA